MCRPRQRTSLLLLRGAARRTWLQARVRLKGAALVHRVVMQSEGMDIGGPLWVQVVGELLVPLVSDLARTVSFQVRRA